MASDGGERAEGAVAPDRPVVLVVEDEPPLLRAIGRLLRKHFEVLPARDAAEAREVAGVRHLDLILTDYEMPGESGVEGLRQLRALGHAAPALIVTATPCAEVTAAIREGLATAMVEKPWAVDELLDTALRLIGRPGLGAPGRVG